MRFRLQLSSLFSADRGSSLVEMALAAQVLVVIIVGAVDFGRAYYLAMEVAGAAHAGAEYGVQSPSDTTGITAAAKADAPDVSNLSVATPAYGCECSDGTNYSASCASKPTCSTNLVYVVKVSVSASYKTLFPWPGLPPTVALSSKAVMRCGGS